MSGRLPPHTSQASSRFCQDASWMSSNSLLTVYPKAASVPAGWGLSLQDVPTPLPASVLPVLPTGELQISLSRNLSLGLVHLLENAGKQCCLMTYHKGYYQRWTPRWAWGTAGSFLWTWQLWAAQCGCQEHPSFLACHPLAIWKHYKLGHLGFGRFLM